jgi:tetratricopeptide (TPR) repeat protein
MMFNGGRKAGIVSTFAVVCLVLLGVAQVQAQSSVSGDAPSLVRRAAEARMAEDWYSAVELYLAALQINPSYADAVTGLAESYYSLEEYQEALVQVTAARRLKGDDPALLSMEAYIQIGLGDAAKAAELFRAVLAKLPNDLEARFGLALLDLRSGRPTDARARLTETLRISPRNARALLSLALISEDSGNIADAQTYLESALRYHDQDARTHYVAARLESQTGRIPEAIASAQTALDLKPSYDDARRLLASLLLDSGDPAEAAQLMEEAVAKDRKDALAWYTLALALARQKKTDNSIYAFETALSLRPDDEIARRALEDLVIDDLSAEDARRSRIASERFSRGRQFETNREYERALSEYRRGLKVDPYSKVGRERYAEILRLRGKSSSYLAELEFLKSLDKVDTSIQDAIDNYSSALEGSVGRSWNIDQLLLSKRPYKIVLFSLSSTGATYHPGAGNVMARALRDELARSDRFEVSSAVRHVASFSEAFRESRESGADWFALVRAQETERDVRLVVDVYVARTGSPAASFSALRSGNERVTRAVSHLEELLASAPPIMGSLIRRNGDRVLVDLGRNDGVAVGDVLQVVRKGTVAPTPAGIGIAYLPADVTAEIDITRTDEDVAEGTIRRVGYLDRSNLEDSVVRKPAEPAADPKTAGTKGAGTKGTAAKKTASASTLSPAEPAWMGLFEEVRKLK